MRATATIARGPERTDVAVPQGTTIAGLLAMLHIDTSDADVTVALPDGRPADLGAVIGDELPSGVLLAVTDARATAAASARAIRASDEARFARATGTAGAWAFATALGCATLLVPLARPGLVPSWGRLACGALLLVVAVVLSRRPDLPARPGGALAVPLLFGLPFAALVEPGTPVAVPVAVALVLVATALAAFVGWLRTGSASSAAAAVLWGGVALAVGAGLVAGANAGALAALLLAAAVFTVRLAPRFALPVPESQLLDLPLVTTSAPAVRALELPPPARVTRRRVAHTLEFASAVTATATLGGAALAVVTGTLLAWDAAPQTLPGQAALVAIAAAVVALALVPRGNRSALVRIAPRIAAAALLAGATGALAGRGVLPVPVTAAGLLGLAALVVLGSVLTTREPASAFLGRVADLAQAVALTVVVPAALLAAGVFDLVREVAS